MAQWNPDAYDAWYETPLGAVSDRIEKELILSMAGIKKGEKALDAGCGTGIYSIELARRWAITTGVDSSGEMLNWARAKARKEGLTVEFVSADALTLPFSDDYFDLVLSVGLLCFVKEREKALLEMRRVLRPGGRLVIGALNRWSPFAALRRIKGLFKESAYREARFFSPPEVEGMLYRAGFETVNVRTCLFFLPINRPLYLKLALLFERLDSILTPRLGAFLATSAAKPY